MLEPRSCKQNCQCLRRLEIVWKFVLVTRYWSELFLFGPDGDCDCQQRTGDEADD